MRVFMLGWEFPPFISGGLGTACYGLTKAMSTIGTDILFVLPRPVATPFSTHLRLVSPRPGSPLEMPTTEFRLDEFDHVTFRTVDSNLTDSYQTPADFAQQQLPPTQVAEKTRAARAIQVDEGEVAVAGKPVPPATNTTQTPGFGTAPTAGAHYGGDLFTEIQR